MNNTNVTKLVHIIYTHCIGSFVKLSDLPVIITHRLLCLVQRQARSISTIFMAGASSQTEKVGIQMGR
jgi:hypothetical protein